MTNRSRTTDDSVWHGLANGSVRQLLTDRGIAAARAPEGGRLTLTDTKVPGLIVRVTGRGKVYAVWFRLPGDGAPKGLWTLGTVDQLSLADARDRAEAVRLAARRGVDPREHERQLRQEAEASRRDAVTVADLARRFIESRALKLAPRSATEYRRCLTVYLEPSALGARPVRELRRIEVREFLDGIERDNGPGMAKSLHRLLRSATAWGLEHDVVETDPLAGLRQARMEPRRRVLSDAELADLWTALDAAPPLVAAVLRFQALTATRFPSELLTARWRDVDLAARVWRIPGEFRKGGLPLALPLSDFAVRLLRSVHELTGRKERVFAGVDVRSTVDHPFERAEAAVRAIHRGEKIRPHDLRRTVADGIVRLGFGGWPTADAVLGHGPRGTARVYVHAAPMVEMAAALEKWGRHVEGLVSGAARGAEVVPIARR